MKRIITVLLSFLIAVGLSGCRSKLYNEKEVKKYIKEIFPKATLESVTEGKTTDNLDCKYYTFNNKGVTFTVYDGLSYTQIDATKTGLKTARINTDYMDKLIKYLDDDISQLISDCNKNFGVNVSIYSTSALSYHISITINDIKQLQHINTILSKIHGLTNDYLPKNDSSIFEDAECVISIAAPERECENIDLGEEFDNDNALIFYYVVKDGKKGSSIEFSKDAMTEADYFLKAGIKYGLMTYSKLHYINSACVDDKDLDNLPLDKSYGNIYINGELFESEKYNNDDPYDRITIVYNPSDNTYYLPVIYAMDVTYNGGVKDFAQREIIEMLYPDSQYTITDGKSTTYTINGSKYEVTFTEDDGVRNYTFKINGRNAHINNYNSLRHGQYRHNATYKAFVSAEDYATLIGCKLERTDYETASLYFVKK